MADVKISAGADPVTLVATDKVPMARSASTTAYAATMAELATYANGAYTPNYYTGTPSMDATGAPGTAAFVARGDHVHPSDTSRLALAGGTMVGLLTLSGAPTANLHAATKLYVDGSAPVGGPYLPLAGGVLTGALTPAQPAGLVGTTTNNSASAGSVGEVITNTGSSVSVTSGVATLVTSVSLTAGDWEIMGYISNNPTGGAVTTLANGGPSNVNNAINYPGFLLNVSSGMTYFSQAIPTLRQLLSGTTTIYLVVSVTFSPGATTVTGQLTARRQR